MILDEILEHKREEVQARKDETPLVDLQAALDGAGTARGFAAALQQPAQGQRREALARGASVNGTSGVPRLIAEIKSRSPSRGTIRKNVDAGAIARAYSEGGASCISVLTDTRFFGGALERIPEVLEAVDLPVLEKDFVLDPYQLYEARSLGADCVLLIVAALDKGLLRELHETALSLGLDVLVETHTRDEVETALDMGAKVVGINNRNLQTFDVSLETTEELARMVPPECVLVAESGIFSPADMRRVAAAGADAVLIGEALMASADIEQKVRELLG